MNYNINKGIGRSVEFQGLKAQYIFLFAGGLLGVFVLVVIIYMLGVSQLLSIALGVLLALALVGLVFHLNARYGEYGLMKALAKRQHPHYLRHRKTICRFFQNN